MGSWGVLCRERSKTCHTHLVEQLPIHPVSQGKKQYCIPIAAAVLHGLQWGRNYYTISQTGKLRLWNAITCQRSHWDTEVGSYRDLCTFKVLPDRYLMSSLPSPCWDLFSEVETYSFCGKSVVSDGALQRQTSEGVFSWGRHRRKEFLLKHTLEGTIHRSRHRWKDDLLDEHVKRWVMKDFLITTHILVCLALCSWAMFLMSP